MRTAITLLIAGTLVAATVAIVAQMISPALALSITGGTQGGAAQANGFGCAGGPGGTGGGGGAGSTGGAGGAGSSGGTGGAGGGGGSGTGGAGGPGGGGGGNTC